MEWSEVIGQDEIKAQLENIIASNPDESEAFFDPANDKIYRHPTFYDLPDGVKHI